MSRRPIEIGHRVEIVASDDYAGRVGIVRAVFKHAEGTVFGLDIEGERHRLSFLRSEVKSLEPHRRPDP
jgi:hypothetical protein